MQLRLKIKGRPFFLLSRFVRRLSGDSPDLSFCSFSANEQHLRGKVPKGSATQSGPFPTKRGEAFFYLQLEFFYLQLSFFAYSLLRPLLDALSHCEPKSSNYLSKEANAVSQKAPIVSKKAKIVNCK